MSCQEYTFPRKMVFILDINGLLCFRLCGLPPFQSKDEDLLYEVIKKVEIDEQFESLEIWSTISEEGECGIP